MEQNEAEKNSQISDSTANTENPNDSFLRSSYAQNNIGSINYNPDLREKVFYLWYNNGRPGFAKTKDLVTQAFPDETISDWSLRDWVTDFNSRAYELDKRVHEQLEAIVVAEKVAMMKRHAETAVFMQDTAMAYLKNHLEDLSPSSSLRMLIEGVRIERESRGIPEALEKTIKMTDDELLSEIKQLLTSSSVTLEDIDADS